VTGSGRPGHRNAPGTAGQERKVIIAPPRPRLRSNRNWRLYWLATSVSVIGDSFFEITVMLWVVTVVARGRPWAPAAASGVLIAAAAPYLVLGPIAGVFVDRWNRRRIMLTADACRCALIAFLLLIPALGHSVAPASRLAIIYAVVAAESCFAQFFNPCRFALLGLVVPVSDQARASGQIQAVSGLANVIGPPLAGAVLFTAGVQWALIIDAVSFAASFAAIYAVRLPSWAAADPTADRGSFLAGFREGLRFFVGNRVVMTVCIAVAAATIGTGALNSIEVFFVTGNLHEAASWLGFIFGAYGIGSIVGNLLGGQLANRVGTARMFSLGVAASGATVVIFSRLTLFPLAALVMGLCGITNGAANAAAPPLILGATPQHLIGRMSAVFNPVQQVASIASMAVAGVLASTVLRGMRVVIAGAAFGPIDTIIGVSGLTILAAGLWSLAPMQSVTRSAAAEASTASG
jgi:MFS family permease